MLMDNDSAVELEMRDAKVLDLLMDAEKFRQQRDYCGEARMLSFALKLKPDDTMIWNKLGRAYRAAGFLDKAVSCYEKVLLLDRDDPWAYANLGGVHLVQENYTAASEFYAKAVWLLEVANKLNDRDYPTILANYAFTLGKTGDKRQAVKLLKEAEKRGYTNCAYIRKQLKLSLFDKLF